MATLIWGESSQADVSSVAELNELLDELTHQAEHDQPRIVELVGDDGATVSIGLGQPLSVANYVPASLDPLYLQSFGGGGDENELIFYYRGEFSEFPPRAGFRLVWRGRVWFGSMKRAHCR